MASEVVSVSFFDLNEFMAVHMETELPHEHKGFFCGDNFHVRPTKKNFLDGSAVIRLHMVDHQVIQNSLAQEMFYIFQKLPAGGPVYRIEQNGLFVQQQISVVGYSAGNWVNIFK